MTGAASLTATRSARPPTPPRSLGRRALRHRTSIVAFLVLLGVACITLLPFYWMLSSSLRTMENMFSIPIQWIPDPLNWRSYVLAWQAQDFTRYFLNSGFVAVAITHGWRGRNRLAPVEWNRPWLLALGLLLLLALFWTGAFGRILNPFVNGLVMILLW